MSSPTSNLHETFKDALEANHKVQPSRLGKVMAHVPTPNIKKTVTRNLKNPRRKGRENIKGKVIDGKHEQYVLTLGMMIGIRQTLMRQANGVEKSVGEGGSLMMATEALGMQDFLETNKYVFPPKGSETTPPHSLAHTFKFKDYAPTAFARIRDIFGVAKPDYITSICGTQYFINFISNSKSQQYFFYSHDGKYLIKTQTRDEVNFLRRMLPSYYAHLRAHPGSLLTRFLGMSRIKFYHLRRKVRFVVMMSVHPTALPIHAVYDIKGCTYGRRTTARERERDARLGLGLHLKDADLVDDGFKLRLDSLRRNAFLSQLALDVAFLSRRRIMDYSLLVGVHEPSRQTSIRPTLGPMRLSSNIVQRPQVDKSSAEYLLMAADLDFDSDMAETAPFTLAETVDSAVRLERARATRPKAGGLCVLTDRRDLGIPAASEDAATPCTYFLGVIDILIKYNAKKQAETFLKSLKADRTTISSVPPDEYAARFMKFAEERIATPNL
mmetsp:Transcript_24395/g.73204  ORF Transcript_24395/g.73204 Transcript_24395/m.73204 type:complete len:497 (-) Transcript_24395:201-1691(-)|eukprot:CAMPEP_0119262248 /NCGR_PEP_ID=MMETSP1329-20130426/2034_1 /TAXON_ID=114041 /ORGANISM="Genus nov. species nov., Strain RCC1024" /LENGTH=496 /DNA_ID=CAMNT_0007261879 /DNA_START=164 /DNA_END=1654 /DNA_ORIENTATION=-